MKFNVKSSAQNIRFLFKPTVTPTSFLSTDFPVYLGTAVLFVISLDRKLWNLILF